MSGKTVLIATDLLSEQLQTFVARSCERLGAAPYFLTARDRTFPRVSKPALFVAGLGAGERHVPRDVLRILRSYYPKTRLLLLSTDALVRNVVSRNGGLLTVIGPPFSEPQLHSRLRMLLAEEPSPSDAAPIPRTTTSAASYREHRFPTYWMADVCSAGDAAAGVVVTQANDTQFLGALSFDERNLTPERWEAIEAALPDEPSEDQLRSLLGGQVGLVRLRRGADDWLLYWPSSLPLILASQSRAPRFFDMSVSLVRCGTRVRRLPAASGDTLIGFSRPWLSALQPELEVAQSSGGAAILSALESTVEQDSEGGRGFVLEVY
jgi:hypothetical protein